MPGKVTLIAVCALVALTAPAFAQGHPDVACKKTETQAECHARLQCKANEELEDCQKRLLACRAGENLQDCEAREGVPAKGGNAGQRGDRDAGGTSRERDNPDRERESSDRERENPDRDRRSRDEGDDRRQERGERRGDGGGRRRAGGSSSSNFQANKTFGLGLELGEPTGLNGKYFLSDAGAFDFGVGWIYDHYYYGDGFHIYADYLWHPISLVSASAFELPLYIGAGLRYWDFRYCFQGVCDFGGSALGIRVPVGISFDFNNVPLDIFIQLVPVVDFVGGNYYDRYRDRAHFGIDLSLGIRYWFK